MNSEPTERAPRILLDEENKVLLIEGKSIMENAHGFYTPILEQLDELLCTASDRLLIQFKLTYFNTSSSKYFLDMLRAMESSKAGQEGNVSAEWFYDEEDLDMKEAGEDYQALSELPFEIKTNQVG